MDVDPQLKQLLRRGANQAVLPDRLHREVLRRARVRRRITAALAAVVIVAGTLGGIAGIEGLRSLLRPQTVGPATRAPNGPEGDAAIPHPAPTGPQVVLAEGNVAGQEWALIAYGSESGLCVDLQVDTGSGGGCGWGVPDSDDLGLSEGSQRGVPATIIHGVLSKRISSIEARLDDGAVPADDNVARIEIIDGPTGFDVNFFVAFLPPNARGAIVAKDSQGTILQSERLRLEEARGQEPFIEEVIDRHKITVYYREGWQRAPSQLAPRPVGEEILSLGTYPLRAGAGECPQIPEAALEDLQPDDAFVSLQEPGSGDGFRPPPRAILAGSGSRARMGRLSEQRGQSLCPRFSLLT